MGKLKYGIVALLLYVLLASLLTLWLHTELNTG